MHAVQFPELLLCGGRPPLLQKKLRPPRTTGTRSSGREVRIRVPILFSVVYFSGGLPQKAEKGTTGGLRESTWIPMPALNISGTPHA